MGALKSSANRGLESVQRLHICTQLGHMSISPEYEASVFISPGVGVNPCLALLQRRSIFIHGVYGHFLQKVPINTLVQNQPIEWFKKICRFLSAWEVRCATGSVKEICKTSYSMLVNSIQSQKIQSFKEDRISLCLCNLVAP